MASSSGRKSTSSGSRSSKAQRAGSSKRKKQNNDSFQETELFYEIGLLVFFVFMFILFLCNFGIIGPVGNFISSVLMGTFGLLGYIAPIVIFVSISFALVNEGNSTAIRKLISGIVLLIMLGIIFDLFAHDATSMSKYSLVRIYKNCSEARNGGGIIAGSFAYLLNTYLGTVGTVIIVVLISTICIILLTEKSLFNGVKQGGNYLREKNEISSERRREFARLKRLEMEEQREKRAEARRLRDEEKENDKILRMEKKVSGVTIDTKLSDRASQNKRDDMHEIMYVDDDNAFEVEQEVEEAQSSIDFANIKINSAFSSESKDEIKHNEVRTVNASTVDNSYDDTLVISHEANNIRVHKEDISEEQVPNTNGDSRPKAVLSNDSPIEKEIKKNAIVKPSKYMFPPLSRLQRGNNTGGDSEQVLKGTAIRLQQTLENFGVKVTITDISQGPSVTRYELQPEQGVKVSKIVGLSDDIKLNLAATDIRIEAPIPGKAAIGIEVPNKENMMVALRDLLENSEFTEFESNLAFAVGKDIAGKVVVADIAKMPHMLIAGSTGSGKSVCINTLIMSILYKAHPDDVKLIMIDPKVVELSVYNGIPHLLIPVVTDPKKASAALHWGVSEMEDRYRKFADYNVRDLKGYNKKIEAMKENGDADIPSKMPQIVIIVDELADLMMVAPGEVEESICRLAQLARAAGIHLVIATQRPSVDVITGLIKANMPSRVAFAVSSGVDSRTILDMNGAEKLLGKGDMLFYPQGYSKPARIQGAFVSDKEVGDVVDFLKNQSLGNVYAEDSAKIEEKLNSISSTQGASGAGNAGGMDDKDALFAEAGRFIIDKDKASIGMLQRVFKIGFNRAARIMDQLCEYGVVGEEEGTKPRKILMSITEFEQLLEEII